MPVEHILNGVKKRRVKWKKQNFMILWFDHFLDSIIMMKSDIIHNHCESYNHRFFNYPFGKIPVTFSNIQGSRQHYGKVNLDWSAPIVFINLVFLENTLHILETLEKLIFNTCSSRLSILDKNFLFLVTRSSVSGFTVYWDG